MQRRKIDLREQHLQNTEFPELKFDLVKLHSCVFEGNTSFVNIIIFDILLDHKSEAESCKNFETPLVFLSEKLYPLLYSQEITSQQRLSF